MSVAKVRGRFVRCLPCSLSRSVALASCKSCLHCRRCERLHDDELIRGPSASEVTRSCLFSLSLPPLPSSVLSPRSSLARCSPSLRSHRTHSCSDRPAFITATLRVNESSNAPKLLAQSCRTLSSICRRVWLVCWNAAQVCGQRAEERGDGSGRSSTRSRRRTTVPLDFPLWLLARALQACLQSCAFIDRATWIDWRSRELAKCGFEQLFLRTVDAPRRGAMSRDARRTLTSALA